MTDEEIIEMACQAFGGFIKKEERNNFIAFAKLVEAKERTWVGLTEEDLKLLSAEWRIVYGAWMDDFARDIEAKLKDKNNG